MTTTTPDVTATVDVEAAERFGERIARSLNDASLALMLSVGHQAGLLDTLAELPPSTAAAIAGASGLQERYVREWLAAMTTAGVVIYDPADGGYELPAEHAACLTRAAGPGNLARLAQFIPLMATVEKPLLDCFRNGGGVPYSEYGDFHRIMAEESAAGHDAGLLDEVLPLVPGLTERLTAGIDVLDVGCGSGHAINVLAAAFPASRFVGYDFSEESIAIGRREAAALGLANTTFEVVDVAQLAEENQFDLITAFDAIHDQAAPRTVLTNIARALRPDGVFLMVDIAASSNLEDNIEHPMATFLYMISTMHCTTVSLSLDGEGLGTMWGEQIARELLGEAGFGPVEVKTVDSDPLNSYFVVQPG
ncbi:MAG: class I SAM-dependent methyltransferase [Acidimicrobiales bacterium]|nr:class I SAM-dependent methyltransferase [Acidimicrobiales bacterium]